ncbi:MAG: D-alanyl-D-alanine carboxypeptidase [Chitinophagales bacterium]|nr:D-alanyl-D-alanine carboxypeptidase [Chitinophagales bacterium]
MTGLKQSAAYLVLFSSYLLLSCSVQQQLSRSAKETVLQQPAFKAAHAGISIYEPATGKYWFNYQGDKYFVPASNTKIPTCYAAMKYLGDSLVGAQIVRYNGDIIVYPSADPTFLNIEFKYQPLFKFLNENSGSIVIKYKSWQDNRLGNGWSWNDFQETYMAERSAMPIYKNLVTFNNVDSSGFSVFGTPDSLRVNSSPKFFSNNQFWNKRRFKLDELYKLGTPEHLNKKIEEKKGIGFKVYRELGNNIFSLMPTFDLETKQLLPFITSADISNKLLEDTLHKKVINENVYFGGYEMQGFDRISIHSQPTDSLLKPMMHRSDNFFAEQSLLMVSNELLGVMNDEKIIDTLLKTDFKDLPQKPRWADGSGLSRYNLFTPQDLVAILNKMKNEFGMERIKIIFPTGGEGTISSYYKQDAGFIYGKTGTLSGVVAFSGFLYTKKGKLLIFSTLINNHQGSATDIRRAIEKFLTGVRNTY